MKLLLILLVTAAHTYAASTDLYGLLDNVRGALLAVYKPTRQKTRVVPQPVSILTTSSLGSNKRVVPRRKFKVSKNKMAGKGPIIEAKGTFPVSVVQPVAPRPVVAKKTTPVITRKPSTNKFEEAMDDIEKALANAQESTRRTRHNVARLRKLQNLIKAAVTKRSYRFARKAIGEAMFTIMKMKQSRSGRRRRRQVVLDPVNFLTDLRTKIGDQAFNDLLAMQGQVTLTFTMDTTGSMRQEITAARKIVRSIVAEQRAEPVDYILSPFNDPVNGKVENYDEGEHAKFMQDLDNIVVHGGGDCPELTFKGMKDAITVGQPQPDSPMYVFTDAGAKDATEGNIKELIGMAFGYSIINFFVFDGPCTRQTDLGPFQRVAEKTLGQVFRLKSHTELAQLTGLTGNSLGGTAVISSGTSNTISLRKRRSSTTTRRTKTYRIPVDDSMETLVISVTLDKSKNQGFYWNVHLRPPVGTVVVVIPQTLDKAVVYQIQKPALGEWSLEIAADTSVKYDFYAKASSADNIDFEFYFVKQKRGTLVPIPSPVKNQRAEAILTVGGVDHINKNSLQAELVSLDGVRQNQAVSISSKGASGVRFSVTFTPPGNLFKIKIKGTTKSGSRFERVGHTAIHSETILVKALFADNEYTVRRGQQTFVMFSVENFGRAHEFVDLAGYGSLGTVDRLSHTSIRVRSRRRTTFTVYFTADSRAPLGATITIVASVKGRSTGSESMATVPLLIV